MKTTDEQSMPVQINKIDFTGQNVYVGIDVHLKSWRVSIMVNGIHHKTFSQDPSPQLLKKYLKRNFPGANYFSAYEAGFCGFWISRELEKLGINCIVVNPADIPTTGKETVQKEDKRDSLKIVKCLRAGLLQPLYIPSEGALETRSLSRQRFSFVKEVTRIKNRLKGYLNFIGISIPKEFATPSKSWTRAYLNWLNGLNISERSSQIIQTFILHGTQTNALKNAVTRQIKAIAEGPDYRTRYELIRSVPGLGLINASTLLLELDNIQRFKNVDAFCSYLGLVPSTHSSGENNRTGNITMRSNKILRTVMIEGAWVSIRRDPSLMLSFIKLKSRMKENRAIVRIAKKLAVRVFFVLKNEKPYKIATA